MTKNTKASDSKGSFIKLGNGELHIKAKPKHFGAVAGVSMAFAVAVAGSNFMLHDMQENLSPIAEKCLVKDNYNNCSKAELKQAAIYEYMDAKIESNNNAGIFFLTLAIISGMAGLNLKSKRAKSVKLARIAPK